MLLTWDRLPRVPQTPSVVLWSPNVRSTGPSTHVERPVWRILCDPNVGSRREAGQMAAPPSPHNRNRPRDEDEDDPVDRMVSRTGCAEQHYAVQDCMAEHQDWRRCQERVQSFKDCMVAFQKARKEQMLKQSVKEMS
ncbi:hypothetical protein GN956_G24721 [Arapaima gigas]